MNNDWENRVAQFWKSADGSEPDGLLAGMKSLVDELEPTDPQRLFEWASVHDFLGLERDAIPIYQAALAAGLDGLKREKAVIQLASSLRNIGQPDEAISLLEEAVFSESTWLTSRSFLALAYFDAGHQSKSLSLALADLYPAEGLYARSIRFYANDLTNSEG